MQQTSDLFFVFLEQNELHILDEGFCPQRYFCFSALFFFPFFFGTTAKLHHDDFFPLSIFHNIDVLVEATQ